MKSSVSRFKSFKEFQISEKLGVPTGIVGISKELTNIVSQLIKQNDFDPIQEKEIEYKINDAHPDFEVKTVYITISLKSQFMDKPVVVEGIYDPRKTTLKRVYITADIFLNRNSSKEDILKGINTQIEGHIYHELLHAYEDRQRTLKKKFNRLSFSSSEKVPAAISMNVLSNSPALHPILREFLFFIYLSTSYEIRARISQAYPFIRDIEDPKEKLKVLKQTLSWEFAENLENFSAEKFMKSIREVFSENQVKKFFKDIEELYVENFSNYKSFLEDIIKSDMDAGEEISSETLKKIDMAAQKNIEEYSHLSPEAFLRKWEKKFHEAGKKSKRKLMKLLALSLT